MDADSVTVAATGAGRALGLAALTTALGAAAVAAAGRLRSV
ncbi:hypothetical protein OHV05_13960 [Kitasatospora sp. NBC_00070]